MGNKKMKHYSLLSFVLSLLGLLLSFCNMGSLISIGGIILAVISLRAKPKDKELAIGAIILGAIGLFLNLLFVLLSFTGILS